MSNICKIDFHGNTKLQDLALDFSCDEIYINKSTIGSTEKEKQSYNFLAVGRSNKVAKQLIIELANNGFFLVAHSKGISLFRKLSNYRSFSSSFSNNDIQVLNDTFFTLTIPKSLSEKNRLLVIFSPAADAQYNASISRRMFFSNTENIDKDIPQNTYILRIPDMGGVLGCFYLNNKFDSNFEEKIQKLIEKIQIENDIPQENTVLYGNSKGATGALYYGIKTGLKTIAIDPIVSDRHFIDKHNDSYFTQGITEEHKENVFNELLKASRGKNLNNIKLITSKKSEQYTYIQEIVLSKNESINAFIFNHPMIKNHQDILGNTSNFTKCMLNFLLYDTSVNSGFTTIY